jgi:CRP-like cAMP-binding protein
MRFSRRDGRIEHLAEVEVFSACNNRQLERIAALTDETLLPANTTLMREGQAGRECFVLLDGEADVKIRGKRVARLGPGDVVGEMALLEHEPRVATVVTRTPVRALVLTAKSFNAVLDSAPAVARRVMRMLAHRLRVVQAA